MNSGHNAFSLAQLLWREEALCELRSRGMGKGLAKKARHFAWLALSDALSIDDLRAITRERLKERPEWPGGQLRARSDEIARTVAN